MSGNFSLSSTAAVQEDGGLQRVLPIQLLPPAQLWQASHRPGPERHSRGHAVDHHALAGLHHGIQQDQGALLEAQGAGRRPGGAVWHYAPHRLWAGQVLPADQRRGPGHPDLRLLARGEPLQHLHPGHTGGHEPEVRLGVRRERPGKIAVKAKSQEGSEWGLGRC